MADVYFGQGFPGGLNIPSELRFRGNIGGSGELVDFTDDVDHMKTVLERSNTPGSSTLTFEFLPAVGNQYDIYDVNQVFVDSDDPTVLPYFPADFASAFSSGNKRWRFYMGQTLKPDSQMLQPDERILTVQCVDNTWWEKYPPLNAALPYPPGGTPFINTVHTSGIDPGSHVVLVPFRMKNIYPGANLFLTAPVSGSYIERVTVESVNYPGQLVISEQILAAGVHTVPISDTTGIVVGQPYHVYNVSDGTHYETIYPTAVVPGVSFTANFVNSHKTGDWVLMAGSCTIEEIDYTYPAYHTTAADAIADFKKLQTITPADISFVQPGMKLTLSNADGTYPEVVDVISVTATTFNAIVAWPKSANFNIDAYPSVLGGPSDQTLIAGEWYQDVENRLTPLAGILYTFYDDSQNYQSFTPYSAGTDVEINVGPALMENIFTGRYILLQNADATNRERVLVKSTTTSSFTVDLATDKDAGFYIFNGPYVDKSRVDEILPMMALTSSISYSNGSVTYTGKTVAQILAEIESTPSDINTIVENGETAGTNVVLRPYNMYGLRANKRVWVQNADGTNGEHVKIKSATRTTITVDLTLSKSASFRIFGRVAPRHYWGFNQDDDDTTEAPWLPQPRYYDAEVTGKLALRVLSDNTVVDPLSGIPFGTYSIRRDGTEHFNACQVIGKNGAYGRYIDWDDVRGTNGLKASGRVLEGPVVTRQDVFTDDQAYEVAAAIVAMHNFCIETPTITAYGLIDPDLFYEIESVTLYKQGEPGFAEGKDLPVNRVRLSFDEDGIARFEYELGHVIPEGLAHMIAGWSPQSQGNARRLDPPVHQTQVITQSQNIERAATAYFVSTQTATANNQRTVTLPEMGKDPTWYATVHHLGDSDNPVIVKAPDNSLIDGQGQVAIRRGGGPLHVFSDGTGYRTISGHNNPHNISSVHGDPYTGVDESDITRFTLMNDPSYTAMVFSGDEEDMMVDIQGPQFQVIEMDRHGTAIYDNIINYRRAPFRANTTLAITSKNFWVPFDCTSASRTVTLPALSGANTPFIGTTYLLDKIDDTANTLTIQPASGDRINNVVDATLVLSARGTYIVTVGHTPNGSALSWEARYLGTGAFGAELDTTKSLEWNLRGIDSRKLGRKDVTYTLPFNAQVSGAAFFHNYLTSGGIISGVPVSGLYNFWRGTRNRSTHQVDWDSSPLNPSPIGLPNRSMNEEGADGTWTRDLYKGEEIAVEVVYADATTKTVLISLDMVIQP